jgi:hypothetical protein
MHTKRPVESWVLCKPKRQEYRRQNEFQRKAALGSDLAYQIAHKPRKRIAKLENTICYCMVEKIFITSGTAAHTMCKSHLRVLYDYPPPCPSRLPGLCAAQATRVVHETSSS